MSLDNPVPCGPCHGTGEFDVFRDGTVAPPSWIRVPHSSQFGPGRLMFTKDCPVCKGSGYEKVQP